MTKTKKDMLDWLDEYADLYVAQSTDNVAMIDAMRDYIARAQVVPDTHTVTVKRLTPLMIEELQKRTEMMAYFAANMAEAYQCAHEFYETALAVSPKPEDAK